LAKASTLVIYGCATTMDWNTDFETLRMEVILLNMHYKYANFSTLGDLKAIINGDPNTNG